MILFFIRVDKVTFQHKGALINLPEYIYKYFFTVNHSRNDTCI